MVRRGTVADADTAALLHAAEIREGFLATLGPGFLTLLYRRLVRDPRSFLVVADQCDGIDGIAGFAAATEDLGRLYRTFLWHDGGRAVACAAPRLIRCASRVRETLRYRDSGERGAGAEVVSVAVTSRCHGRGIGRALVEETKTELARRGVGAARVVAARDNEAALALYRACGFRVASEMQVHRGTTSVVLVWP
ncbi:MAG: GNAT family N-acetyltransferase [Acidimicrobiales bacterium]